MQLETLDAIGNTISFQIFTHKLATRFVRERVSAMKRTQAL